LSCGATVGVVAPVPTSAPTSRPMLSADSVVLLVIASHVRPFIPK
jgi:hypothetical protein